MKRANTLQEIFSFPGFRAKRRLSGVFGDPLARIVDLERRKKGLSALAVALAISLFTIGSNGKPETCQCLAGASIFASSGGA